MRGGEIKKRKHGAKRELGVETFLRLFFVFFCFLRELEGGGGKREGGRDGKTIDLALVGQHKTNLSMSRSSSRLSSPNEKRDKWEKEKKKLEHRNNDPV